MDQRIDEILKSGKFKISLELVPSLVGFSRDGILLSDFSKALSVIESLKPSFISVAQGPGGSERDDAPKLLEALAATPLTSHLPRLAHLICGYRPKSEVLKHADHLYSLAIRNFLVLHGDAPILKPSESAKPLREETYEFAYECIRDLRSRYRDVVLAGAAYPDDPDHAKRIDHLKTKFDAGADFAITQMTFSAVTFAKFIDEGRAAGIVKPILPGVRFLKTQAQADAIAQRFKVRVPRDLPAESENPALSVHQFTDLVENLRASSADAHLFLLSDFDLALAYCQQPRDQG